MSMFRIYTLILSLLTLPFFLKAQWEEHYSYNGPTFSGACSGGAYVGNSTAFFKYSTDDLTLSTFSKNNCLSSVGISAIYYTDGLFFVGYTNGSIDIIDEESLVTHTITDLKEAENITIKSVNAFCKSGSRLYCAFSSGLLEINLAKYETKGYYRMSNNSLVAYDVTLFNDSIYVATSQGIKSSSLNTPVMEDTKQWLDVASNKSVFCSLKIINDHLYAVQGTKGNNCTLYRVDSNNKLSKIRAVSSFRGIDSEGESVIIASQTAIAIVDTSDISANTASISKFAITKDGETSTVTPNLRSVSLLSKDIILCADVSQGMVISDIRGNAERHLPQGPANSYAFELLHSNGTLYVSYGGLDPAYNNLNRTAGVHILNDGVWANYTTSGRDLIRLCADPNRPDSVYVSAWGTGVLKLDKNGIVKRYNEYNSTLEDIFAPNRGYNRCGAIAYDNDGNLYVANAETAVGIKVKLADGTWTKGLSYIPTNKQHSTTQMICTSNGNMWLSIPRTDYNGLMVFNVNGTPEDDSDDSYRCTGAVNNPDDAFLGRLPIVDQDGEEIPTKFYALAEDRNGIIWIGTSDGIYRCSQNDIILKDVSRTQYFEHVKVPRNDGTNLADYLLGGVNVSAILVDPDNRKWIGTATSGLYLVSADGLETLEHFTAENSPLPDNQINSLAFDEKTGKLYISSGTVGIVAYQTDSKSTEEKSDEDINLMIYPNPVLPSFSGDLTIEGLPDNVDVRISDVQGRLVYNGKPSNGTVYWNLARFGYGPRVATGIYIVWVQSSDGKQKAVGKISVVK